MRARHSLLAAVILGLLPACAAEADGGTEDEVNVGTTSEALSTSPATSYFVSKLYSDLLGRAPSSADLSFFVGKSRTVVADAVLDSAEYRSARVRSMYQTFLGRTPPSSEISPFLGMLASGGSMEDVSRAILVSAEYYARGGGTAAGFVSKLYADLLGRTPGSAEIAAWSGMTATQIVPAVQASSEARTRVVTTIYASMLRRAPSTADLSHWLTDTSGERIILRSVATSDEYAVQSRVVITR